MKQHLILILSSILFVGCVCHEDVLSTNGLSVRAVDSNTIVSIRAWPNGEHKQIDSSEVNVMLLSTDTICEFEIITNTDTGWVKLGYQYEIKAFHDDENSCNNTKEYGLVYLYSNIRVLSHSFRNAPIIRTVEQIQSNEGNKLYTYILEIN